MRATNNEQVNTKVYWNHVYNSPAKYQEYWAKTYRFFELYKNVKKGQKFLDIGCGVGIPAYMLKKKKCETWGVDISSDVIELNKKIMPYGKWHQGYVGGLDFLPKDYFDVIFAGEVIEHLDDPSVLFEESYKFLKSGGKLVITTPHEDRILSSEHVWFLDKEDVENFYLNAGFKKVKFVELPDTEHIIVIYAIGIK